MTSGITPAHPNQVKNVLTDVQLPLRNVEYTIEQYLLLHGTRLDTETRFLLAGVRDRVGQIAGSARQAVSPDLSLSSAEMAGM